MADDRDRGGNTTYIERGGSGMSGVLMAIAAVAMTILALGAWVSRSVQGRARAHMPG